MTESEPLCCCEYYDMNNERNHILACFCNCVDLDEAFDSLTKGKSVSTNNKSRLLKTMRDRIRIPWIGGAVQISFDSTLPCIILPVMFLSASISLWWTVFSFTTVAIFVTLITNFLIRTLPKTQFFYMWTIVSIGWLYCIFEFVVIPFLEILLEENIALSVLIFGFIMCMYLTKTRANDLIVAYETEISVPDTFQMCKICDTKIPDKDHHCLWFDCCISKYNQRYFISALFFAILALLYSSNLTLTTVCHPFTFYKSILLPDDCSDVYNQFELALSFVTAVYGIFLAILLFILFCQQILLISIGVPLNEWKKLTIISKLCLGLGSRRIHNRGFFENWSRIICWNSKQYNTISREREV